MGNVRTARSGPPNWSRTETQKKQASPKDKTMPKDNEIEFKLKECAYALSYLKGYRDAIDVMKKIIDEIESANGRSYS